MKTFDEYVTEWLFEYIKKHNDTSTINTVNKTLFGKEADLLNQISECEAIDIYKKLIINTPEGLPDIPKNEDFLSRVFKEYVSEHLDSCYHSFANELVESMAYEATDYDDPSSFFSDLAYGGCSSGMIGMLIYNHDCMEFYKRHANEMEEYREEMEEEYGSQAKRNDIRHYVWMCWLCYEEIAYRIATALFPDKF